MGNYTTAAFVLTLIGGILILLGGVLIASLGNIVTLGLGGVPGAADATTAFTTIGAGGAILGLLVIISSVMLRKPGKTKTWGIIALILSAISFFVGGGFLIGLILGVIGGILAIVSKK